MGRTAAQCPSCDAALIYQQGGTRAYVDMVARYTNLPELKNVVAFQDDDTSLVLLTDDPEGPFAWTCTHCGARLRIEADVLTASVMEKT
jgi:hypothetical protein